MKILKEPVPKKLWTAEVTCYGVYGVREGCGATLEIEEDDLFRVQVGNAGFERFIAQFQCQCGARTDFDEYPEPSVLLDYSEHLSYLPECDLKGYSERGFSFAKSFSAGS
jgi:hypothetical protein